MSKIISKTSMEAIVSTLITFAWNLSMTFAIAGLALLLTIARFVFWSVGISTKTNTEFRRNAFRYCVLMAVWREYVYNLDRFMIEGAGCVSFNPLKTKNHE